MMMMMMQRCFFVLVALVTLVNASVPPVSRAGIEAGVVPQAAPAPTEQLVADEATAATPALQAGPIGVMSMRKTFSGNTDMILFRDMLIGVLVEGTKQNALDGVIRVMQAERSANTSSPAFDLSLWNTLAEIDVPNRVVMMPKLCVSLRHTLMLTMGIQDEAGNITTGIAESEDGKHWSRVRLPDVGGWVHNIAWHVGTKRAYGLRTTVRADGSVAAALVTSSDTFEWFVALELDHLAEDARSGVIRIHGDTAVMAVSTKGLHLPDLSNGTMIGHAKAPFTRWSWHRTTIETKGPSLAALTPHTPGAQRGKEEQEPIWLVAGAGWVFYRTQYNYATGLWIVDPYTGATKNVHWAPSLHDSGRAGLVAHDDAQHVYLSYQSQLTDYEPWYGAFTLDFSLRGELK